MIVEEQKKPRHTCYSAPNLHIPALWMTSLRSIIYSSHSAIGKRVGLSFERAVEGSIFSAGKRISLKNLNVIIRAIN